MDASTYCTLAIITISVLLGAVIGFWLCFTAVNWMVSKGTLDFYRNGTRLEQFRMW